MKIRYTEDLVKDKWVTYAGWRFTPDVEKTMSNILASQDITFAKEGDKRYKLQNFSIILRLPTKERAACLFKNLVQQSRILGKAKGRFTIVHAICLRLSTLPSKPNTKPIVTGFRKMDGYTIQNVE